MRKYRSYAFRGGALTLFAIFLLLTLRLATA
jgi:hypothetical protein